MNIMSRKGGRKLNKDWKETLLDCIVGVIIILIPLFLIYVYQNSSPPTDAKIFDTSIVEQYDENWIYLTSKDIDLNENIRKG